MSELKWNEYEVIECLGVLPEKEEFFTSYNFRFNKDGLFLEMTIWPYESCIALSISKESDEKPFMTIYFIVRDKLEFISAKNFASLQFLDALLVSSRFWMSRPEKIQNYFDKNIFAKQTDFELIVYPRLEFKVL